MTRLLHRLDSDVYQIIKKLEEESTRDAPKNGRKRCRFDVDQVYQTIRRSNSSLSRQKRKPLEDAIERVLKFHRQQADDSDSEAAIEIAENKSNKPEDRFLLNRQMVKHWDNVPHSTAMSTAQGSDGGQSPKKRRLSLAPEAKDVEAVSNSGRDHKTGGVSSEVRGQLTSISKKTQKPSKYSPELITTGPTVLGGVGDVLRHLDDEIFSRIHPPVGFPFFKELAVGYIIVGPPGTGKESIVRARAANTSTPVLPLGRHIREAMRSPEKASKLIAESFDEAMRCAPCLILVERLHDLVAQTSSGHGDFERLVIWQLQRGIERLQEWHRAGNKPVIIVATTSKLEVIDQDLLRCDGFAIDIQVPVPDAPAREDIFRVLTRDLELAPNIDFMAFAKRSHNFVGEDIRRVIQAARQTAWRRLVSTDRARARRCLEDNAEALPVTVDYAPKSWEFNEVQSKVWDDQVSHHDNTMPANVPFTQEDIEKAIAKHKPFMRRMGFSDLPSTTWSEVGGLQSVRDDIQVSIVQRIKKPEFFKRFGKHRGAGAMLYGPPGCGKTLIARAAANDAQASFILVKGPELLNKYVGESERAIRELFMRAKSCAPCIIFFDEMDSLVPKRENTTTEAGARVVNALLSELDGGDDRGQVYVIGTSNRIDMIDPAILRPGRLEKKIFVGLPTEDERVDILRAICRSSESDSGSPESEDATMGGQDDLIEAVARDPRCQGFSGADMFGLYQKAQEDCILQWTEGDPCITRENWEAALEKTKPSVSNPEFYGRV